MPISLAALTADRRTVKVPFGDDTLTLTYRPSAVNARQEARELEDREHGRHLMAQARSLAEIVDSWDVVDDKGKPLPITDEVMAALGLDVTQKLIRAILADLLPNPTRASDSRNGSSPMAGSEPVLTGTS